MHRWEKSVAKRFINLEPGKGNKIFYRRDFRKICGEKGFSINRSFILSVPKFGI